MHTIWVQTCRVLPTPWWSFSILVPSSLSTYSRKRVLGPGVSTQTLPTGPFCDTRTEQKGTRVPCRYCGEQEWLAFLRSFQTFFAAEAGAVTGEQHTQMRKAILWLREAAETSRFQDYGDASVSFQLFHGKTIPKIQKTVLHKDFITIGFSRLKSWDIHEWELSEPWKSWLLGLTRSFTKWICSPLCP